MRLCIPLAGMVMVILAPLAHAADEVPPPAEHALAVCVGPGVEIADPFEALRGLPQSSCEKACKAAIKGCISVVKAQRKCGKAFIKSIGKVAAPVCQGLGGTKADCKEIKYEMKSELELWDATVDAGYANCLFEGSACYAECR